MRKSPLLSSFVRPRRRCPDGRPGESESDAVHRSGDPVERGRLLCLKTSEGTGITATAVRAIFGPLGRLKKAAAVAAANALNVGEKIFDLDLLIIYAI